MSDLEKALDRYFDKFKSNYPLVIVGDKTDEEVISDIDNCIKSGKQAKKPDLFSGVAY